LLSSIFDAKSVVLIGSSKIRERVGMCCPELFNSIRHNMEKFYAGQLYVIDIERPEMSQVEAELAVVVLPPLDALYYLKSLENLKAAILITGGYNQEQKYQLLNLGIRVLGPNTIFGVINTVNGLNTSFEPDLMPKKGTIAIISQSGGVGAALIDYACYHSVGISKIAFTGKKFDVTDVDIIGYLSNDNDTKVILLYIEGVRDGKKFIDVIKKCKKPVVVLKGGLTEESGKRAMSHTASVSGTKEVFDAAFKKAGAIRVQSIEQLFDAAVCLECQPRLKGKRVAIVSNVGGPSIIAADWVIKVGLELSHLQGKTKKIIESKYPGVDLLNPIDLIADARAERYKHVLDLTLKDPNVDGLILITQLKSTFLQPKDVKQIIPVVRKSKKPVIICAPGGFDFEKISDVVRDCGIPVFDLPSKAVKAMRALL